MLDIFLYFLILIALCFVLWFICSRLLIRVVYRVLLSYCVLDEIIRFSNQIMTDMHLMYGLAECNSTTRRRLYAERFRNRCLPNKKTFQKLHERLRDTAHLTNGYQTAIDHTLQERFILKNGSWITLKEMIIALAPEEAAIENIAPTTVWTILLEQ